MTAVLLMLVAGAAAVAAPLGETYRPEDRVKHLHEALQALVAEGADKVGDTRNYIDVMARNSCVGGTARLRTSCMMQAGARYCRSQNGAARARCLAYLDVIVVNKLGEGGFVTTSERYALMRTHRDYRGALRQKLRQRYGELAARLSLRTGPRCDKDRGKCVAQEIDTLCQELAGRKGLSWHHCAGALVWFVGTAYSQRDTGT